MKNILLIFFFSITALIATDKKDVAFIHGLNGNENTWKDTANKLAQEYFIKVTNQQYDESASISSTASSYEYYIPPQAVGVAHSMGGLLAREIIRKYGKDKFSALITTGTPHTGAKIAAVPGNASILLGNWIWDLALPWYFVSGSTSTAITKAEFYVKTFFDATSVFVDLSYDLTKPSMADLTPSSPFLNTLNYNPSNTFPNAYYLIWGDEDWMMPWRLGDTQINNKETGDAIKINKKLQAYYIYFGNFSADLAQQYHDAWINSSNFDYLNKYFRWTVAAMAFFQGAHSLAYGQQIEWDYWVTGSYRGFDSNGTYHYWPNDGVVPFFSQAPNFVLSKKYLQASHTNHLEEPLPYGEGYLRIRDAFNMNDVNVPKNNGQQDPLSLSVDGPFFLGVNQAGSFTAYPAGGSGNYTDYRWWWRSDAGSSGGLYSLPGNGLDYVPNGEWFELTLDRGKKTISLGKPDDFSVKCEVTDSENHKANSLHSVSVTN